MVERIVALEEEIEQTQNAILGHQCGGPAVEQPWSPDQTAAQALAPLAHSTPLRDLTASQQDQQFYEELLGPWVEGDAAFSFLSFAFALLASFSFAFSALAL
ncbi:hypothetical protein CYMTET_52836 [Cymbomonas tetramitiformis]|uniref:Uncharacterized protein n=1 Tax=Cymbomonas tetramitiformis TaxID=36881 RepID=A0AAE0BJK5_9CHLO|nr:hypothetical protein CYMTET_52836 [Cymbomonas tetramitiformis]